MSHDMENPRAHSMEFEIDLSVEDLLDKLIQGQITPPEVARYNQLLAQRSRMMRPTLPSRGRRRVAA
ncbi:MAG: hypothetical protein ABI395_01320 [Sphingobium sp.]